MIARVQPIMKISKQRSRERESEQITTSLTIIIFKKKYGFKLLNKITIKRGKSSTGIN